MNEAGDTTVNLKYPVAAEYCLQRGLQFLAQWLRSHKRSELAFRIPVYRSILVKYRKPYG